MFFIRSLLIFIVASQDSFIEVTYNDQTFEVQICDLNVTKLKSIFNIPEVKFLEDLNGKKFYPSHDGIFPPPISAEVYIRQILPNQVPVVIYPSESKFVFNTGSWSTGYWEVMIGYSNVNRNIRIGYIQFKDLNLINRKKKISKVYLRMVGSNHECPLSSQIFVHRCETDWQGIINWNQQPVYKPEPYSSTIVREALELTYYWDVTGIVVDWATGAMPNYGIALKTNNTYGIPSTKQFHNNDPVKKPALLVYYSD